MGNHISFSAQTATAKLIFPDHTIHNITEPTTVAELMLEHPHYFVVEFEPSSNYKANHKLAPLHADYALHADRLYLMVPMSRHRAGGLSVNEASCIVAGAQKGKGFWLFGACVAGGDEEEVKRCERKVENDEEMELLMCRQYSSRGWRPSLGTIEEVSVEKKKIPHWLF